MKRCINLSVLLLFLLCLGGIMAGCVDPDPDSVTSITLSCTGQEITSKTLTVNLSVGTLTFTADVQTTGKASKEFALVSSNADVATVSGKTVTLVGGGQSTITAFAISDQEKTDLITLKVTDDTVVNSVTSITLSCTGQTISDNSLTVKLSAGTLTFTADVQVTGSASKEFTLASSNSAVATVSEKTVTLKAGGETTITATAVGDTTKTHAVTLKVEDDVSTGTVTSISLRFNGSPISNNSLSAYLSADSLNFTADVGTTGDISKEYTISSSSPTVAYVSGKTVHLVGEGQTAITAIAAGDTSKTHAITLKVVDDTATPGLSAPRFITNNFGENSSTELLVQWHNDDTVSTQKLQIARGNNFSADAQIITVTGEQWVGDSTVGTYESRNVFKVHVTGLSPSSNYKYRVGDWGAWSDTYNHTTSSASFAAFSFTVVTDPQNATFTNMEAVLNAADAYDSSNKFYLMLGDLVNDIAKNRQEIVNYTNAASIFNKDRIIAATQGNHDTYRNITDSDKYQFGEATVFNRFITFPDNGWDTNAKKADRSQSYYFYYNNVLFIMLNTMAMSSSTTDVHMSDPNHTEQAAWLRKVLTDDLARPGGRSKYIIVGTHVPAFTGRTSERWLTPAVRAAYGPICAEFGVDIFFAGHDHLYGRTNPIKVETGKTALSQITYTDTSGGTIYSITNSTGPKFYQFETDNWVPQYFPVQYDQPTNSGNGLFVNVKVTADKLTVTAIGMNKSNYANDPVDTYEVLAK